MVIHCVGVAAVEVTTGSEDTVVDTAVGITVKGVPSTVVMILSGWAITVWL